MFKARSILFIGSINLNQSPLGGQEFKNQLYCEYLKRKFNLSLVDTYNWDKNPLIIIKLLIILTLFRFDKIIISASSLSTYRLIKLIYFIFPWLSKKIIYAVIGGYFPEGISSGYYNKKFYNGLNKIIVEGQILNAKLNDSGLISNVLVIPNFKQINRVWISDIGLNSNCFRFVFISSIMEAKGVKTIFVSLDLLKKESSLPFFKIDFYGPIEDTFKDQFNHLLNLNSDICSYCGYLNIKGNPDISYPILSEYDAMLFPSFYKGEGFPGVVLDAYIAGLPVIASDWNMNCEVVKNGETGLIVPPDNPMELASAMIWMLKNKEELKEMKRKSNELAYNYDVDTVLDRDILPILYS